MGLGYNTQFLLYSQPDESDLMNLFFAVLYDTQRWALHVVTKRQFFTFIFADFQSQATDQILQLPHLENGRHGNSTCGFDFDLLIDIGM